MIKMKHRAGVAAALVFALAFSCVVSFPLAAMAEDAAGTATAGEAAPPVTLRVDERIIETDVPPQIVDSRTLVPVRAVFEAMGATVEWNDTVVPAHVDISSGGVRVGLIIGDKMATVYYGSDPASGVQYEMDVPAQIIGDRTLIPVRFVSEQLNYIVRWSQSTRTVDIFTPGYPLPPVYVSISALKATASATGTRLFIATDPNGGWISSYEFWTNFNDINAGNTTSKPSFFIEIPYANDSTSTAALNWQRELSMLTGVAAETVEHDGGQFRRYIFELREQVEPVAALSGNAYAPGIFIDFSVPKPYDPWSDGRLIVAVDAGHGIDTIGKESPDKSFREYEFNRDMAAKVGAILNQYGIEVVYTAPTDIDTPLAERCRTANSANADVFVSLHANAGGGKGWQDAQGWEIYVYKKGSYSEKLAKAIHDETMPASGLKDRGIKDEAFYVIRKTNMPAVLIEHGFYTNQWELSMLTTPEVRENLAMFDARGIMDFLGVKW